MDALSGTWIALCGLALVLGMKHGFDADHLATIDGLTRFNARTSPRLSRLAGTLFSLGHGAVVVMVVVVAGLLATSWQAPSWLEVAGAAVSVLVLFGLALINVRSVLIADPSAVVAPAGFKGRFLARFLNVRSPWAIAAVGALFAISFDTVSQAALLALGAARFGSVWHALIVAGLFVLGMLVVDGANGLWISRLIRRADRTAVIASRVMALAVAGVSLAVGVFTVVRILIPAVDAWAGGREITFGALVVLVTLAAFAISMWLARSRRIIAPAASPASGVARLS